jgi:hypothetical protein
MRVHDLHMDQQLLKLGGTAEQDFWRSEAITRQTQLFDLLGLGSGLVINIILTTMSSTAGLPHTYRMCCIASAAAIATQMAWALVHPRSYIRCRIYLTLAHRLRWVLMSLWLCTRSSNPWDASLSPIRGLLTAPGPITWKAFAAVAVFPPLALVHQSVSFPLPFRHALACSAVVLVSYFIVCLPDQLQAVQLLQLQRYASSSCMATPAAALPTAQQLCASGSGHVLLFVHTFLLVGMLLPLQLVYWQECSAKTAFLRARGVGPLQEDGCVPLMLVVTVWAIVVVLLAAASA